MMIEKLIAAKDRKAIEDAAERREFRGLYPFDQFPNDCCEHTCDVLAYLLSLAGVETVQIKGTYIKDETQHHVWLQTEAGVIIDITEDQFAGTIADYNEVVTVRVGDEGPVQRAFCMNRTVQENTGFMNPSEYMGFNKAPSVRQKRQKEIYQVIKERYSTKGYEEDSIME